MVTRQFAERWSFYFFALILSAAAGAATVLSESPWYSLVGISSILLFILFSINNKWGIYALLIASLCTAVAFEVGPFTIRPEQVITLVLAGMLFLFVISGKYPLISTTLDWLILAYLFVNILSSLVHSPDPRTSLQKCLLLSITFAAYFVTTHLIRNRKTIANLISFLILAGVLEAFYGIISVYLFTRGIDIGGAHAPYGDIYARGTFVEGNIFGSFEMMVGLILISFLFNKHFQGRKILISMALLPILIACVMSYTRAAWIGFFIGVLAYIFLLRKNSLPGVVRNFPLLLITILVFVVAMYSLSVFIKTGGISFRQLYIHRVQSILNYQSTTSGSARVKVWIEALKLWQRNPILGNGTDSIKSLAVGTAIPKFGTEYWIPSSLILALHDTGIAGLAIFIAIQIVFLVMLRKAMKKTDDSYDQAVLHGFFIAFLAVQITYFFTNAFWLVFIWVFLAIGISCCRLTLHRSLSTG